MDAATTRLITQLGAQLTTLTRRVHTLERASRTTQLEGATVASSIMFTDSDGNVAHIVGLQPDGSVGAVSTSVNPPDTPSTPQVVAIASGLVVTWDGNSSDGVIWSADFSGVQIHLSTVNGFTPSIATLQGVLTTAGSYPIGSLTIGTTYYVQFVAQNTSGLTSPSSAQASGIPTGAVIAPGTITQASLAAGLALAGDLLENSYCAGGDTTGWTGHLGTTSSNNSPPGHPPNPGGWVFEFVSTSSGGYLESSPAIFPVTPNTQYMLTCWANAPSGTNNLSIGFTWQDNGSFISSSTQTFNGVGDFQQYTQTFTSPASGVNQGFAMVGPTASGITIYAWGIVALPQVPGALIQAGSVTATQIAAQTITAALIAANTITGAQISAGVSLSAPTISGGTFIGTNWIENSSGQFLYSGSPAANNLVLSIVPGTATIQDAHNNWCLPGTTFYNYTSLGGAIALQISGGSSPVQQIWTGTAISNSTNPWNVSNGYAQFVNIGTPTAPVISSSLYGDEVNLGGDGANTVIGISHGAANFSDTISTPAKPSTGNSVYAASTGTLSEILASGQFGQLVIGQSDTTTIGPISGVTSYSNVSKAWTVKANDPQTNTKYRITASGQGMQGSTQQVLNFQLAGFGGTFASLGITSGFIAAGTMFDWKLVGEVTFSSSTSAIVSARVTISVDGVNLSPGTASQNSGGFVVVADDTALTTTADTTLSVQARYQSTTGTPTITGLESSFERIGG